MIRPPLPQHLHLAGLCEGLKLPSGYRLPSLTHSPHSSPSLTTMGSVAVPYWLPLRHTVGTRLTACTYSTQVSVYLWACCWCDAMLSLPSPIAAADRRSPPLLPSSDGVRHSCTFALISRRRRMRVPHVSRRLANATTTTTAILLTSDQCGYQTAQSAHAHHHHHPYIPY